MLATAGTRTVKGRKTTHDQRPGCKTGALVVILVNTVVADLWVGHDDDLSRIGRIRNDLLITGHTRIENHLTPHGQLAGAGELAVETAAVGENEFGVTLSPRQAGSSRSSQKGKKNTAQKGGFNRECPYKKISHCCGRPILCGYKRHSHPFRHRGAGLKP